MEVHEHLLTIVAEECAEVAQRASKALRFGLSEIQPGQPLTNAERIIEEYDDLRAAIELLQDQGLLPSSQSARIDQKKEKVEKFLHYSYDCGTVSVK